MRIFILFLLTSFTLVLNAQNISGNVKDGEGKPLQGVTISLLKDSAVIKLAATKENGAYQFSDINAGTYKVSASYVGHAPVVSAPVTVENTSVDVPDLQLTTAAADLKGVTINC